jgi:predicted NUDIX family phosphoesterase
MKICCVETRKLPPEWIGGTHALDVDFFSSVADMCWIERSQAETDAGYKQIIPYIIVQNTDEQFLCYQRHGTEQRLHGLYSCGIGGHIEEPDKRETSIETVRAGMLRELSEELGNFEPGLIDLVYKGIINETETAVGLVHVGLVYLAQCHAGYIPCPGEELAGMEWKEAEQLGTLKKEIWSDLAFTLIV